MRKHSVIITGHPTSLSIEEEFWSELKRLAQRQGISLAHLIEQIDNHRQSNLSSSLRVYVLNALKEEVPNNK